MQRCPNEGNDAMMEPPSQAELVPLGWVTTFGVYLWGTRAATSLSNRSAKPGYMVLPPDKTMLLKRSDLVI
jgi:hypothetical protein